MTTSRASSISRHRTDRSDSWQIAFCILSMLAVALMPLNMVANAQAYDASVPVMSHSSDCDMGSKPSSGAMTDTTHCVTACSALPAAGPPSMRLVEQPSRSSHAEVATTALDGAELEPVPPPPRHA